MSYICEKIDFWIEKINDIPTLNRYRLIWMDFDPLFNKLNDEVNKAIETCIPDNVISKSNTDLNTYLNDQNNSTTNNIDKLAGRLNLNN